MIVPVIITVIANKQGHSEGARPGQPPRAQMRVMQILHPRFLTLYVFIVRKKLIQVICKATFSEKSFTFGNLSKQTLGILCLVNKIMCYLFRQFFWVTQSKSILHFFQVII